jgi:hypothetical protein
MKKWIVYSFLVVYLFSTTELSELLKVDELFNHFQTHQDHQSSIDFSEFIYIHYINHGKDNGDEEKDNKLPFQSHSESCSANFSIPAILPLLSFNIELIILKGNQDNKYVLFKSKDKLSSFLNSIWQPPKLV